MGFLNVDKVGGKTIHTSARNDGKGNPITDVADKDVKSELELVKTELKEIKEQLATGIPTQLKGSNVEYFNITEVDELEQQQKMFRQFNTLIIDAVGSKPHFKIEGRNEQGYKDLPYITKNRMLIDETIYEEGRYFFDLRGYTDVRILKTSSTSSYELRSCLSITQPPEPMDTNIQYKRITPEDGVVTGLFRAIEPLTDITLDPAIRFKVGLKTNVFQNTDVRLAGQPLFGPFTEVKINEGVALLVEIV